MNRIVQEEGFAINAEKTRLMGQGTRQTVTGVVVNRTLGLSRQERRCLRALAHQLGGKEVANEGLRARFAGKVAYLSMLNPQQAAPFKSASAQ